MQQINNMAQLDKTDFYWNGILSGAVNNLYYDFVNVDVVHVPYTYGHRNSSFFLQTRRNYYASNHWTSQANTHKDWDVVDVRYIWENTCSQEKWEVYIMLANKARTKIRIHKSAIENGCVEAFDWSRWHEYDVRWCWCYKLFTTNFVKWPRKEMSDIVEWTWIWTVEYGWYTWIQINKYTWWTTVGLFSDKNVEEWTAKFANWHPWQYLLVYESRNGDWDWFAWQVRMITWKDWNRLMVDSPCLWFRVPTSDEISQDTDLEIKWWWLKYRVFDERWEVIWFTEWRHIYLMPDNESNARLNMYTQIWLTKTDITWIAEAADKIFILTDNGFIHYSNTSWWYNKFFINDDMFAGEDKIALAAYKDIVLAFGRDHIAVWIPDDQNRFWTMYNQSASIWLWSRYSFAEYEWDLLFVSNDKRLLALWVANNAGKYMLQHEDVWDMINGKLSTLIEWDEIFLWNDKNQLRIFVQTTNMPYYDVSEFDDWRAKTKSPKENSLTRIYKFDTLFKVWTEDIIHWILLQWVALWVYYWGNGLYERARWRQDVKWDEWQKAYDFKTYISAYLIENENNWLDNHPLLFNLAKLNRLITTLWFWEYSADTEIRITSYSKGIGRVFKFPVNWDWNTRLWIATTKYLWNELSPEDEEKVQCMLSTITDSQKSYQPKCTEKFLAEVQDLAQQKPWCASYDELITLDKGICIDDSIYEIAPTMPLVTDLWEAQDYATQIKLELVWWVGDIITFGWRLAEMFVAPLFMKGPDWEYQLDANPEC